MARASFLFDEERNVWKARYLKSYLLVKSAYISSIVFQETLGKLCWLSSEGSWIWRFIQEKLWEFVTGLEWWWFYLLFHFYIEQTAKFYCFFLEDSSWWDHWPSLLHKSDQIFRIELKKFKSKLKSWFMIFRKSTIPVVEQKTINQFKWCMYDKLEHHQPNFLCSLWLASISLLWAFIDAVFPFFRFYSMLTLASSSISLDISFLIFG